MTGKVNPQNDGEARRIASEHVKKQEAQRIKELEAIDPDQKAKQQQFRNLMQPADDEENDASSQVSPTAPSPLQPSFYKSSTTNTGIDPKQAMPSPAYSPAPNINELPADSFGLIPDDPLSDAGLPQSQGYYQNADLPWQPINSPDFEEDSSTQVQIPGQTQSQTPANKTSQEQAGVQKAKGKADHFDAMKERSQGPASPHQKGKQLDANPFGPPGKPTAPKSFEGHVHGKKDGHQDQKRSIDANQPTARYWNEEKIQNAPPSMHTDRKDPERKITGSAKTGDIETRTEDRKAQPKPFEAVTERAKDQPVHEETKQKARESKKESSDVSASNQNNNIAPQFQPAADTANIAPSPYLRPELMAQFCQMVGTVVVSQMPKGVSKTEFLLNDRFANGRFAGTSIEITRHSTAPSALNIRISGSPEAVSAFNQSKDSLMATFNQDGKFSFTVNRIDIEQSRPVFHRKDKGQDHGDSNQQGKQQ